MLPTQTDLDNDNLLLKLSLARITFLTLEEKKKFANLIDSASKLALFSIEEIEKLAGRSFTKRVVWNGAENLLILCPFASFGERAFCIENKKAGETVCQVLRF